MKNRTNRTKGTNRPSLDAMKKPPRAKLIGALCLLTFLPPYLCASVPFLLCPFVPLCLCASLLPPRSTRTMQCPVMDVPGWTPWAMSWVNQRIRSASDRAWASRAALEPVHRSSDLAGTMRFTGQGHSATRLHPMPKRLTTRRHKLHFEPGAGCVQAGNPSHLLRAVHATTRVASNNVTFKQFALHSQLCRRATWYEAVDQQAAAVRCRKDIDTDHTVCRCFRFQTEKSCRRDHRACQNS